METKSEFRRLAMSAPFELATKAHELEASLEGAKKDLRSKDEAIAKLETEAKQAKAETAKLSESLDRLTRRHQIELFIYKQYLTLPQIRAAKARVPVAVMKELNRPKD